MKKVWISVLIISLLLVGCKKQNVMLDLAICGSYAVPGMFCSDLKGGTNQCEILETDSKGRILFSYTAQSVITGKTESAVVVCQAIDTACVYFYEDQCYLLGAASDMEIESLKTQNDWNAELDYDKMAKRPNDLSLDLFIITQSALEYNQVVAACCKKLAIQETQIIELCFLDQSSSDQELYWLSVKEKGNYFLLINTAYETAVMQTSDSTFVEDIVTFKQENGWCYDTTQ